MSKVKSMIGVVEEKNGKIFVRTNSAERGCVVYGPYEKLGKGRYLVKFGIRPDENASRDLVCCRIDVVTDFGGAILVVRNVTVGELRDGGDELEVKFELPRPAAVEYRFLLWERLVYASLTNAGQALSLMIPCLSG